ncbi:MAG: hypothetical protein HQK99_08235, partial [Nitrospirae bacterium]|nr:hypothetical protein [Nitrospirota bacterium]
DNNGYVYVAEGGNNRIQKFTSDGTFVTKWGSSGAGNGMFNSPGAIVVDNKGYVYVVDSGNYRIQKFAPNNISSTDNLTITKSGTGSGTVTTSSGTLSWSGSTGTASYTSGTSVTLAAVASSGSTFTSWSGCDSSSGSTCTVSMSAAKNVTATFTSSGSTSYTLSVMKSGTGSGTVTASSGTLSWSGSTGTASYTSGTSVTLTAVASSGSTFTSWSGCDSSSGSTCTVSMSATKSVTATFTSGMSDSDAASAAFDAIYSQYVSWFGSKSGSLQTGTSWVAYYQLYTIGAYLVAGTDGNLYVYYNGQLTSLGLTWQPLGKAASKITSIYNQYASWFGSTSGGIGAGTSDSGTYYYQWYTNGAAIVAWTDGSLYTYYNGTSYALGVKWE